MPCITKRIGVTTSQRLGSAFTVPIYFVFPALSRLHDAGPELVAAVSLLLFAAHACSNAVSSFLSPVWLSRYGAVPPGTTSKCFLRTCVVCTAAKGATRKETGNCDRVSTMLSWRPERVSNDPMFLLIHAFHALCCGCRGNLSLKCLTKTKRRRVRHGEWLGNTSRRYVPIAFLEVPQFFARLLSSFLRKAF